MMHTNCNLGPDTGLRCINFRQNLLANVSAWSNSACKGALEDLEFRDNHLTTVGTAAVAVEAGAPRLWAWRRARRGRGQGAGRLASLGVWGRVHATMGHACMHGRSGEPGYQPLQRAEHGPIGATKTGQQCEAALGPQAAWARPRC